MLVLNVFSILFEIVSAYGSVGLSLGYLGTTISLSSAQLTNISKQVIIAMSIRKRNRLFILLLLDLPIILPIKKLRKIGKKKRLFKE